MTLLDRAGNEIGTASGPPAHLTIAVPPGVDATQPLIATTRATLEEQWTPAPTKALRRATRWCAPSRARPTTCRPWRCPPSPSPRRPGVRVYVDPPQSEDRQNRGAVTGRRIDKVTYVFEAGGRFTLPGVAQPWWDLDARRLHDETRPAVTVSVTAPPKPPDPWLFIGPVLGLLVLLLGDRWLEPGVRAWHAARHARWLASEAKAFDDLAHACRSDDVRAIYRAFTVWRRRTPHRDGLAPFAEELESALYAGAAWPAGHGPIFFQSLRDLPPLRAPRRKRAAAAQSAGNLRFASGNATLAAMMRRLLLLLLTLFAFPAFAKDELVLAMTQAPGTMNPLISSMLAKSLIQNMTARPITAYDPDWKLVCLLCTELPTPRERQGADRRPARRQERAWRSISR